MKMLSIGNNSKLGKNVGVFNLPPRITCPGATSYCSKVCYAMKSERLYKGAREMRARNYIAAQGPNFIGDMIMELTKFKGKYIRIHESGDMFSQEYLDKWTQIADAFPNITFLTYTKMYDRLDFTLKPANMVIYASYDPTTVGMIGTAPAGLRQCVIEDPKYDHGPESAIDGWYRCPPVSKTHRNYCGSNCTVCWAGSNNVIFPKH